MTHDSNTLETFTSPLIRADGSLKADLIQEMCQAAITAPFPVGEPIIVALHYLSYRDAFRVFLDPLGNIGEGHFTAAKTALTFAYQYLEKSNITGSTVNLERILAALGRSLDDVMFLQDIQQSIDQLLQSNNPDKIMATDVQQLIQQCNTADDSQVRSTLECSFWLIWVKVWALRINCIESDSIDALKSLYNQCPWLDRRFDERKILRPPGGMLDPDEQPEEADILLF